MTDYKEKKINIATGLGILILGLGIGFGLCLIFIEAKSNQLNLEMVVNIFEKKIADKQYEIDMRSALYDHQIFECESEVYKLKNNP